MRSGAEHAEVMALVARGLNDCAIAAATGVPRTTVRDWRRGRSPKHASMALPGTCQMCGKPIHDPTALPRPSYDYLLGMYLGDGDISRYPRAWRLRIALDMMWPGIMNWCAIAMQDVFPENKVSFSRPDPRSWCAVVSVYSKQIVCLFPQHGAGPKHLRRIELVDWQEDLVVEQPQQFLRGLIHSDGSRFTNRVRVNGKEYEYPRYTFTSASDDIRGLFTASCDQIGIKWRQMNARNFSVARRESVALLDEFVGPKN